jgi:hypothetical protein
VGDHREEAVNNMKTWILLPLAVTLFGCPKPADTDDTDVIETDVEETDVEETDVEETDVEETDVEETDVEETDVEDTDVAPFAFQTDAPSAYTRVDRMGMPAINTAVITSKDAYNADDPTDDAAATYVPEITANLTAIHAALDDDLATLLKVPCTVADCVDQAAPLVVPDTIAINTANAAGFPNGRKLSDPVIDVTLAVVLLDLTVTGQTVTTFAELPLNPPANDVAFGTTFPYLAPAH